MIKPSNNGCFRRILNKVVKYIRCFRVKKDDT